MIRARRRLLATLAAGLLWPELGGRRLWSLATPASALPIHLRLVGLLRRPDSAAFIGRAYLEAEPAEAELGRILALLLPGRSAAALAALPAAELRRLVTARHRGDFSEGRTVSLGGWILSRTEARLYAVAALTADGLSA